MCSFESRNSMTERERAQHVVQAVTGTLSMYRDVCTAFTTQKNTCCLDPHMGWTSMALDRDSTSYAPDGMVCCPCAVIRAFPKLQTPPMSMSCGASHVWGTVRNVHLFDRANRSSGARRIELWPRRLFSGTPTSQTDTTTR